MKKLLSAIVVSLLLALSTAVVAFANPPTPACNGLDVAHHQTHGSGTQGELTLHSLRTGNHCAH